MANSHHPQQTRGSSAQGGTPGRAWRSESAQGLLFLFWKGHPAEQVCKGGGAVPWGLVMVPDRGEASRRGCVEAGRPTGLGTAGAALARGPSGAQRGLFVARVTTAPGSCGPCSGQQSSRVRTQGGRPTGQQRGPCGSRPRPPPPSLSGSGAGEGEEHVSLGKTREEGSGRRTLSPQSPLRPAGQPWPCPSSPGLRVGTHSWPDPVVSPAPPSPRPSWPWSGFWMKPGVKLSTEDVPSVGRLPPAGSPGGAAGPVLKGRRSAGRGVGLRPWFSACTQKARPRPPVALSLGTRQGPPEQDGAE